jgi:tetratricopeptide (TPR) repeat protein
LGQATAAGGALRRRLAIAALWLSVAGPAVTAPSGDGADQALLADADYSAGLAALKGGDMPTALSRFQAALKRFPDSAGLHNELGFAHRKAGQLDKAFEHYKRALAIDPRHRSAHEYIGEAYLMAGDVASAEKHLAELRSICLLPCEELTDLRKAIEDHKSKTARR